MVNTVIDFNRSCDESIFETCIQHQVPKMTRDVVLLYDISDHPRTDCNSIIVTCSGQWYITHVKQLLNYSNYYKITLLFRIFFPKKLQKEFLPSAKKFLIVLTIFSIFLFILFQNIIMGVVTIIVSTRKKSEIRYTYTLINH